MTQDDIERRLRRVEEVSARYDERLPRLESRIESAGRGLEKQGERIGKAEARQLLEDASIKRLESEMVDNTKRIACIETKAQRLQGIWAVIAWCVAAGGLIGAFLDRWFLGK